MIGIVPTQTQVIWAVVYGNYWPTQFDSFWVERACADAQAQRLNQWDDNRAWRVKSVALFSGCDTAKEQS